MRKHFMATMVAALIAGHAGAQSFGGSSSRNGGNNLKISSTGTAADESQKTGGGAEKRKGAGSGSGAKKAKGPTEIIALESNYDQKASVAVFTGSVVVKDPDFNVTCDKLTAYLKHGDRGDSAADSAGAASGTAPKKSGGLDKAIAVTTSDRRVVITQDKKDADGNVIVHNYSVGNADQATYDATTGDTVLTGNPDVVQGSDRCVATEPGTVMILNRDGHMKAIGPHRTIIVEQTEQHFSGSDLKMSKAVGRSQAIIRGVLVSLGASQAAPAGMHVYAGADFKVTKCLEGSCGDEVAVKIVVLDNEATHETPPDVGGEYIVFISPGVGQEQVAMKILPFNDQTLSQVTAATSTIH